MTTYTVASIAGYDGSVCPHPDVSTGSGVDVAKTCLGSSGTMAALATAMQGSPGFYTREALLDSDLVCVNVGPEFGIISFYRDFPMSKFWAAYSVRSETVSGTQRLRFCSKGDSRLSSLESALQSCGYPISGLTDSYGTGTDITNLNTALYNAKIYMCIWRA